jgi:hypothetical protein
MVTPAIVEYRDDGPTERLLPTTMRALGKNELFLEQLIATHLGLLELENIDTGIRRPFKVFTQNDLKNAFNLTIIPDLLIFSSSGHVIIVEVKLSDNPELRNRKVLSQVIDYSGAFVDQSDEELLEIFSRSSKPANTWPQLIESFFPKEENIDLLSDKISNRLRRGEVKLVIACDKAPPGLKRFLSGISRQSALPFSLSLSEITPYVKPGNLETPALFISKTTLRTEVISRTAVTVRYEQGANVRPSVRVETTPLDEIERGIFEPDASRFWTESEIDEAVESSEKPIVKRLYNFIRTASNVNQMVSPGKKINPTFAFYLRRAGEDGIERTKQIFNYRFDVPIVKVYLNMLETLVPKDEYEKFLKILMNLFPEKVDINSREPFIPIGDVEERFDEFCTLIESLVPEK